MSETRLGGLPRRNLTGELTVIEAATLRARLRGLGGLDSLPADHGLEIRTSSIHTYTVHFPLDLIWRDANGGVLRVDRAVPRWRMRTCWGARTVIEVGAGHADAFIAALAATRS